MDFLKRGFENTSTTFKIMYLVKAILILMLCRIHDFTRYKLCRSFEDLFYWPEGPCIDMLVVFGVLLLDIWVIYDQYVFVKSAQRK